MFSTRKSLSSRGISSVESEWVQAAGDDGNGVAVTTRRIAPVSTTVLVGMGAIGVPTMAAATPRGRSLLRLQPS